MAIEIFGPDFRKELLADLISLNREALKIAQFENSKSIEWVTMKRLEKETGWGRTKLTEWRNQGKFNFKRSSENGKVLYDLADVNRFLRISGLKKGT
ncbi:phage protein [Streptococcus equi subsp. equi]|uniref:MerR family transcriptional regulator n=1 Tax=Streptococcus equi TaxID=1336 RepID=UPI000658C6B6|nr:MerR family transcriptional regulator [Streptococcus equi]CRU22424.1 phage protein [Streptococcus equi subsp. equi]CRU56990.1 phage protein [Streptococcus equi subsp. equi]CRU63201.1 phage protein [Streptococcus equi subsp. equi]CRU71472.1 phage protein [Streptococcus equi subsp. equi]CRU83390.1 phage protein [Streptococcus equi subsp. equi]